MHFHLIVFFNFKPFWCKLLYSSRLLYKLGYAIKNLPVYGILFQNASFRYKRIYFKLKDTDYEASYNHSILVYLFCFL